MIDEELWFQEFKEKHPDARRVILFSTTATTNTQLYPKEAVSRIEHNLIDVDGGYQIYTASSYILHNALNKRYPEYNKHVYYKNFTNVIRPFYKAIFEPKVTENDHAV